MEDQVPQTPLPVPSLDLAACDREPIHIPGSIQPHGLLLVADRQTLAVLAAAGDVEGRLSEEWRGAHLCTLVACEEDILNARDLDAPPAGVRLGAVAGTAETFDAVLHHASGHLLVELEPTEGKGRPAATVLAELELAATRFERAPDLRNLCEEAADAFRSLTGFDRVMIYQFLEDGGGVVLGEARTPDMGSFLNHHFPAADIPKQARALYVRNRIRVTPDVDYIPAPVRPGDAVFAPLDLTDVTLRSVSPIHLQYLRNMGVAASASASIVKDGVLWGLVACHHRTPRALPYEVRMACHALANTLTRQIRAKEDAVQYRERIRLRGIEDTVSEYLSADTPVEDVLDCHADEVQRALGADGFAVVAGQDVRASGRHPGEAAIRKIVRWLDGRMNGRPLHTHALPEMLPDSGDIAPLASGLLAVSVPGEEALLLLWFRAEHIEVVNWAGNPHKERIEDPEAQLTPRASFEAWSQTVRGRSRRWSVAEIDTTVRLGHIVFQARQHRRIRELNRQLSATVVENERLLQHKDYLMREVNHRVQNSLQLVSSFLRLQARTLADSGARDALAEAERRIAAVGLVHRQLYGSENVETVDLSRYLADLCGDVTSSLGEEWRGQFNLDLSPILIPADRAVRLGLILTELILNTAKYAYRGKPGPVHLALEQHHDRFLLVVADRGVGKMGKRQGFGTVMLNAMVQSLHGSLEDTDNAPGLRTLVSAPVTGA